MSIVLRAVLAVVIATPAAAYAQYVPPPAPVVVTEPPPGPPEKHIGLLLQLGSHGLGIEAALDMIPYVQIAVGGSGSLDQERGRVVVGREEGVFAENLALVRPFDVRFQGQHPVPLRGLEQLEQHLAACAACARDHAELRKMEQVMDQLYREERPDVGVDGRTALQARLGALPRHARHGDRDEPR